MLSDFDIAGFPVAAPLSEVKALEPVQADIDADLLLVSQIGGLRAKSAQARAANAKLNAAIVEARERREESEKLQKLQKQQHLNILSRWLMDPRCIEGMWRCFGSWRCCVTATIRARQADEVAVSISLHAWRKVAANAKQCRDAEVAAAKVEKLRGHLLWERCERRLSRICNEIVLNSAENYTTSRASSPCPEIPEDDCGSATVTFPMGATERQVCGFFYAIWKSLVRLQLKTCREPHDERTNLSQWESVLIRLTKSFGWHDDGLCLFAFARWRDSCLDRITEKASFQERVRKTSIGDASFSFLVVPLVAITLSCWKVCTALSSMKEILIRASNQLRERCLRMHLQVQLRDLLGLWAMVIARIKNEAASAAQCVEMRVLQRRALNAAFSTTLDSDSSWQAAVMFYRWRCEILHERRHSLLIQSGVVTKKNASVRSRMIALLHVSQLGIRMEHLTLAWNTWRQWQARQNSRKWREQAQETLRSLQVEQDAKASARLSSLQSARSSFIDSRVAIENLLCLRDAFETMALHARVETTMQHIQTHVVSPLDAERTKFYLQREKQRERLVAQIFETESRIRASDCLCIWQWEIRSARHTKWSIGTTSRYLTSLFDSSAWISFLPLLPCWYTWKTFVSASLYSKHQHHCKQVRSTFSDVLSVWQTESLMQFFISAWRLACVVYSTKKLEGLESQCDELLRLLEIEKSERGRQCDELLGLLDIEKSEREKAVAKTLWQQEILSKLELASQNEARVRSRQAEAEEIFKREAEKLRTLQATVITMVGQFQTFVDASPQSNDNVLMKRSEIFALVDELRRRIHMHISGLPSDTVSQIFADVHHDISKHVDQKCQDAIASSNVGDLLAQTEGDVAGNVQMQSPLTASSVWVENTWQSPQGTENPVANAAIPQVLEGARMGSPRSDGEERFIKRCGELTRQQEAFIAKLRAHPEIGLDELRSQCSEERAGSNVTESLGCKSWHDISSPLCAVADTPFSAQDYADTSEELLGASLEKPVSPRLIARQYSDGAGMPNFIAANMSAGSEAVCRQLSFDMRGCLPVVDFEMLAPLAHEEKATQQNRRVSFDLADEVFILDDHAQDVSHQHQSQPVLPQSSHAEKELLQHALGMHALVVRDGDDEDRDEGDSQAREFTERQLVELREKLQSFLSTHGSNFENLHSTHSGGNCSLDEGLVAKYCFVEDEENSDCEERLEELRQTLLDGLPDFSCRVSAPLDPDHDATDLCSDRMTVAKDQNSDSVNLEGQKTCPDPTTWPNPAYSWKLPLSEGAPHESSRSTKQFFEGALASPTSFATRLQGFSFGMSEDFASSSCGLGR